MGRGQPVLKIEDARMRRHQLGVETDGLADGIAGPSHVTRIIEHFTETEMTRGQRHLVLGSAGIGRYQLG